LRTVVVDNGSADNTVQLMRNRSDVLCVDVGANVGYAEGINIGRRHAGEHSTLVVLNPDLVLAAGALRAMVTAAEEPGAGIVVPALLDASDCRSRSLRREPTLARAIGEGLLGDHLGWRPAWLSEIVRADSDYGYRHQVDWASGAAMLISTACEQVVGPWDERFFLYSEEVDYCARARAAGFRVIYEPAAMAWHRGAGSGRSDTLVALMAVNRIRYMDKHARRPGIYRAAVVLHELLRAVNPGHRAALRAVVNRARWPALSARLRYPSAGQRERTMGSQNGGSGPRAEPI
jgi:GT2 family glycosyltransferase